MKRHRFGVLKDWCVPGKGTECLPAVAATLRSLLNAETGAPGYFGLFGWPCPFFGLAIEPLLWCLLVHSPPLPPCVL